MLDEIQQSLYDIALERQTRLTSDANTWEEFEQLINKKGGFVSAHWDGTTETADKIKDMTKATIRCIPLNSTKTKGKCILTGALSEQKVLFAKAY